MLQGITGKMPVPRYFATPSSSKKSAAFCLTEIAAIPKIKNRFALEAERGDRQKNTVFRYGSSPFPLMLFLCMQAR
jgi:hypothetical protein